MNKYKIQFDNSAYKELEKLEKNMVNRIWVKIKSLAENPRPPRCKKLNVGENLWRIRVGDYRVIYGISDTIRIVTITEVKNRKNAYR